MLWTAKISKNLQFSKGEWESGRGGEREKGRKGEREKGREGERERGREGERELNLTELPLFTK
jgi:hypothetical protein